MKSIYAKLISSESQFSLGLAPDALVSGDVRIENPTDEQYLAFGYKKVVNNPYLPPKEGYRVYDSGYIETSALLSVRYQYYKIPDPVYRYSKLRCVEKLIEKGYWPKTKAYIEQNGLYDLYVAAQDFASDNAYFQAGLSQLSAELSVTQDDIREVLDYACI